jgi:hypothetical protein
MTLFALHLTVCLSLYSQPHANELVLYAAEHAALNTTIDAKQTGCLIRSAPWY